MNTIELALVKEFMDKLERMTIALERMADSQELIMINNVPDPIPDNE